MSQYTVLSSAVDAVLSRKSFAAHDTHFDVEPHPSAGLHELVFRSNDKFRIGKTDKPAECAFLWNDETGAAVPFPLVQSTDRPSLVAAQQELIAFYTSSANFSDRLAPLGEIARAVLPLAMAVFGGAPRVKNGWKVGSIHAISDSAARKERDKQLAIEAAALKAQAKAQLEESMAKIKAAKAEAQAERRAAADRMLREKQELRAKHEAIQAQIKALQDAAKAIATSPVLTGKPGISASTQATINATVANAFAAPTTGASIDDLWERLGNPPAGMEDVFAEARKHCACDTDAEQLYLEALNGSTDDEEFASCVRTLIAERTGELVSA